MRARGLISLAAALTSSAALASGAWCDATPIGGVELGPGETRAELNARLDEIERLEGGGSFMTVRARGLAAVFDHVRLAVNTNDLFVHWHPDTTLLPERFHRRQKAFAASSPERADIGVWMARNGAFNARLDVSHTCPDWESVLALGPRGLAARAKDRMRSARTDGERLFLTGVATVYEALARECLRWAELAESKGMRETAAVLRENAAHEPRTLREALQWALVYDRAQEAEGEDVRSQGIFDRLFLGFYRADLAAGRETRESAKRLVADWFDRFWSQNHPNNKNITIGGYDTSGAPVWNELTELAVEVFHARNRICPKLTYRFGSKTPREQLERLTRCLADGRTSVVFANDDVLFETFRRQGKEEKDLPQYVLIGCYEPGIGGREIISSMSVDLNLAKPVELAFERGATSFAEFERAYFEILGRNLEDALALTRQAEERWAELNPAPLFSGSFADCIANARDMSAGGCRYNQSGVDCAGLATAVDSLAAVRHLVEETRAVSLSGLKDVLAANWKGREDLRLKALRGAPKWGNNDPKADGIGRRIADFVTARVNGVRNGHGGTFQAGIWSINLDIPFGERMGATPDGRLAGSPISRNNVASAGCGRSGPTALMLSNLKLDQTACPDGHILDALLPRSLSRAEEGPAKIAALIAGYFAQGGQCLHLNCFDAEQLRDAMAHPGKYEDLQVRVCGWNVRWNDLSKVEQLHFLATAESQEER